MGIGAGSIMKAGVSFGGASEYDRIKRLTGMARQDALAAFLAGRSGLGAWLGRGRSLEEYANDNP